MKQLKVDDLARMRDSFFDLQGEAVDQKVPGPDEVFPIIAGPWPNPFPNAIKMQCNVCQCAVGMSLKGMVMHEANPKRLIFCSPCGLSVYGLVQQLQQKGTSH